MALNPAYMPSSSQLTPCASGYPFSSVGWNCHTAEYSLTYQRIHQHVLHQFLLSYAADRLCGYRPRHRADRRANYLPCIRTSGSFSYTLGLNNVPCVEIVDTAALQKIRAI